MPMLKLSKKLLLKVFIFTFVSSFVFAETEGLVPCVGPDCGFDNIFEMINRVVSTVFPILTAIGFILITYGGIVMMTARENAEKFKTGKTIVLAVAVGIIIIYGAKFIVMSFLEGLGAGNKEWFEWFRDFEKTYDK